MLYFHFNKIYADEIDLIADNCDGQNKKIAVMYYFSWTVMTGKNMSISLKFLLTGHAKFTPDRNFGILKSKYAKSVVDCFDDFITVIKKSSSNGFNLAIPSKDPYSNIRNVFWAEWDVFLKQRFNPIPSVTKYHHFSFYLDGIIRSMFFSNSPQLIVHKKTAIAKENKIDYLE